MVETIEHPANPRDDLGRLVSKYCVLERECALESWTVSNDAPAPDWFRRVCT